MANRWGIDLGGTKLEGVILDNEQLDRPICRVRIPTEAEGGYEHILGQLERLLAQMSLESGMRIPPQVGIGTPGVVDAELGTMKSSNTQCLNGRRLRDDLSGKLGCEVRMANDANCFALAEYHMGVAKGYAVVFGVILGTGVGGGIVINGQIINGRHGIAGEWGQLVLDPQGPISGYGTRGTVESLIAGPSLEKYYQSESGTYRKLKEIVSRVERDAIARATMDRLFHYLSKGLAMVINVLDPHAIILGGGVGNVNALYSSSRLRDLLSAEIFNRSFDGAILQPALGDSAGVFGAAMLVD